MSRETIQIILNQSVNNFEQLKSFDQLVKASCNELNISPEDEIYIQVEAIKLKMGNYIEELNSTIDPQQRSTILNNISSCRNQICTTLQKLFIDNKDTTTTTNNL